MAGTKIVQIGATMRRPLHPWSPAVHEFLRYLERVGFTAAPRFLGIDEQNREIVSHIAGTDGRSGSRSEERLAATATLIRELHRVAAGFRPAHAAGFRPERRAPAGTLICHNDLSPPNTIFRAGRPVAFIDWDLATPSTALWDLSYAARTFVPLYPERDCIAMGYEPQQRAARLRIFCDAYGLCRPQRQELLPLIDYRLAGETTGFAARCRDELRARRQEWCRACA